LFRKFSKFILNLFFPKKCLGCNKPDTYLCRDCFNKIEISFNNECFFCKKITWQGKICLDCKKEHELDRLISVTDYKKPLVRNLIKKFKYRYIKELSIPLSQLLIKSTTLCGIPSIPHNNGNTIIVPVPLHKIRMRKRGFNQAELLAKEISNNLNLPLETNILKRIIPTEPQANIKNEEKRKINIKNVFNIDSESLVRGKTIILIDDVATTGATLSEAGKILKRNGANEVWGLVIAKGK